MAKKKDIIQKEIIFPCGNNLIAQADYGYAFCRQIRHESVDGKDESKFIEECQGCTKGEKITCAAYYTDSETGEKKRYKDTFCIGYSQEYLDNKGRPTADWVDMDGSLHGPYSVEVIFQCEDYRRVEYFKGSNINCSTISLMENGLDDLLEKSYRKEDGLYHLIMFNMQTGRVLDIDFENEDEVKNCIVSVRLLQPLRDWENIKDVVTPGDTPMYICPVCKSKESKHLYGIEFMENRKNRCPHCGRHLKYPEERRS